MIMVYHRHMRALGYCNKGLRPWFAGLGISWDAMLKNGVPVDILRATGNAMAIAACELAEKEAREQGQ